ncbi:MAG: hypothetical protein ACI9TV_001905 [Sulfurimonas sp.]|jgi:hypothetical protein|uniref:hypothetical protein n=1 Tax=Sulfurimonas sp. TaxID=2022749 RepID=UPI0039E61FD7
MKHEEKVKYIIFSTYVFILMMILFVLAAEFNSDFKAFLVGNVIPELIGICIEILVIIWFFENWQRNKESQKTIVYEKRLREYLIFFLKYGLVGLPESLKIGNFFGNSHTENKKEIKAIIDYLNQNEIDIDLLKKFKYHLKIDKTAFENLLEVAALLSDEHFKSWIRIVYFINKLDKLHGNDKKEHKVNIMLILREINRFDKASNEHQIYVGSNI